MRMKITICGSMGFYKEMEDARDKLLKRCYEVKIPELALEAPAKFGGDKKVSFGKYIEENGGINAFPAGDDIWNLKESSIWDHFEKIEWSDAILVVNEEKRGIAGYVGGNTLIEIGVAFYLGKKIYIVNDVSAELSYKQEILGMKPVMLLGNFNLIA